jgi:hypothetical protein
MTASPSKLIAATLREDDLIPFLGALRQSEQYIPAKYLREYVGGDRAAPSIRPERGAHPAKVSDFPNAERSMKLNDRITGLQDGVNVNFSMDQITKGASGSFQSADGKTITVTNGLITLIE